MVPHVWIPLIKRLIRAKPEHTAIGVTLHSVIARRLELMKSRAHCAHQQIYTS